MKCLCIYYIPLFAVRLQIAQWYDGIIPSHEKNGAGVFMLTVITDILFYILIRHTPTLIGKKNLFYNALLFHSTSFVSFAALSRPLSHAWITFLLVSIKIFSLYRMNFFMMLFIAIGMLVPFHNQTLLFTIMCWPLCIKQWILSTKYDQYENQRNKLINCCLLIILSIYTYINSKPTRIETWILPPWMLYYNLYFILYELSEPFKSTGKTVKEIYHCGETCNSDYQATNNIKKTPRPSVRVRVEHFIENIHVNQSSSYIQLFISTFYYCCMESIPLLFAYKLYRNSQIRPSYPSSSFGLGLILLIGREFPYDVNELLTKRYETVTKRVQIDPSLKQKNSPSYSNTQATVRSIRESPPGY